MSTYTDLEVYATYPDESDRFIGTVELRFNIDHEQVQHPEYLEIDGVEYFPKPWK